MHKDNIKKLTIGIMGIMGITGIEEEMDLRVFEKLEFLDFFPSTDKTMCDQIIVKDGVIKNILISPRKKFNYLEMSDN